MKRTFKETLHNAHDEGRKGGAELSPPEPVHGLMDPYEHRQIVAWPVALALAAGLAAVMCARKSGKRVLGPAQAAGLGVVLLQFRTFTTRVDDQRVSWAFGAGFPAGSLPIAEIAQAELVKTALFEGWGIHWTPRSGWLWNNGGTDGVQRRCPRLIPGD